jgi:phage regulator Rha-like protein
VALLHANLGCKHKNLVRVIENVLNDYPDLRVITNDPKDILRGISNPPKTDEFGERYYTEERVYRGQKFTAYLMNREFFSLVAMRLKTKKARQWQRSFNSAFYAMEKRLLQVETNTADIEWTQTRLIGKTARREETNVIREFVDYATLHGSKSAKFYYKHITNATYKALGLMSQKNPKLRDEMNIYQISELMLAERLATARIKQYMDQEMNYKGIYTVVKADLIAFANALRLTKAA